MFECDKCGICCKNLSNSDIYIQLDRGDGVCKYLNENNLCSIYDSRPLLCNIDESYKKFFKDIIALEDYYRLNYDVCKKLKNGNLLK